MKRSKEWFNYQERVAAFFRELGFDARTNEKFTGARVAHAVDVSVRFERFGIPTLWVVECKLWKTSVPQEKVMALQTIMADVGADKGFLLSESGFQSGAIKATEKTNVLLTNLDDLRASAERELAEFRIQRLLTDVEQLLRQLMNLITRTGSTSHSPKGTLELLGRVAIFEHVTKRAAFGFPVLHQLTASQCRILNDFADLNDAFQLLAKEVEAFRESHKPRIVET